MLSDNTDQSFRFKFLHLLKEYCRQPLFVGSDTAFRLREQPFQCGMQSRDAGKVQCPRLKPIRQEIRDFLRMADAAGSPCNQRFQF